MRMAYAGPSCRLAKPTLAWLGHSCAYCGMNPAAPPSIPTDLAYVALLFALFVLPKALQRYRIPSAISALLMGVGARAFGFFDHDPTVQLLATFGIVALFLFAGLEINGGELRRGAGTLLQHAAIWATLLA